MGSSKKTTGRWLESVSLLAALFISSAALAGWNTETEEIEDHPTWIYTPDSTLPGSEKHGLMVVLHGCYQTHDQIKNDGNLEKAAEEFGLVMAAPFVTLGDAWYAYPKSEVFCWDYDGGIADSHEVDNHGHIAEIIALTEKLKDPRRGLNIDPNQVYVVGLSSGGALALKLGCKAPDIFAGIGAIAGPSVGSNQGLATLPSIAIPPTTVDTAVSTCTLLAQDKISSFNTQITSIAYGNMDASLIYHRNATGGPTALPSCNEFKNEDGPKALSDCEDQKHPGQDCVASIKWNDCNIKALQRIYKTGDLGPGTDVQEGKGTERTASAGGKTRLSLLVIDNVGHAWPAGKGKPNNHGQYIYIAQEGLNYPRYIAEWLVEHNLRSRSGP